MCLFLWVLKGYAIHPAFSVYQNEAGRTLETTSELSALENGCPGDHCGFHGNGVFSLCE